MQIPPSEATVSVPRQVAEIRVSLSLQIKQLAAVLHVERPTVYAWINEQSIPHPQKRMRLRTLYELAKYWDELAPEPLGKSLTEPALDGPSVFELLQQAEIPQPLIRGRFERISSGRIRKGTVELQEKRTLTEIAEKHGVEWARVKEQDGQIDILTGKRVALV
jgi:transcriptional regulator with XRE-family HTH domain